MLARFWLLLLGAAACSAQWEFGGGAGYGIYRNASIFAPAGTATAGFRNRFALTAVVGEDISERIGGEFRYTYQDGDPFLASGRTQTNIQGQSHAFTYDMLVYPHPRGGKLRPYVAAGFGAKLYVVTGPARASPPLSNIGLLTTRDEAKVLVAAGGGLKFRAGRNILLRLDFRDYITPFPKKLLAPVRLATPRGIFHQFTPLMGVSYVF